MRKIILASASPRRKQLLENIGLEFVVEESGYPEEEEINDAIKLAKHLSLQKAKIVAKRHKGEDAVIIGSDTVVWFEGKTYGKPADHADAKRMLSMFSGKMHEITTGFTIIDTKTNKTVTKSQTAKVFFKKMTEEELDWYVATGEPMGKGGAYAAQQKASMLIERVEGDFFTVVGLPVTLLVETLKDFGISVYK